MRRAVRVAPDVRPSAPPEVCSESARALLAAECQHCRKPITGRAGKLSCSGKCRAALSRKRQSKVHAERAARMLTLISEVVCRLEETRRLIAGPDEQQP